MNIDNAQEISSKLHTVAAEIKKVVVGQDYMINRLLIGLMTNGHVLLEGLPGLAKTLTVNAFSKVLGLDFQRIQFTPDLLPSDLIGTMIYNPQKGSFEVKKGPIFSNIILADEINRSPAKVQAALLESMAERQVTIGDTTYILDKPFLVLATQNPIEQEGTYNLPEAQIDRFLLKVKVAYPSKEDELEVMRRMSNLDFKAEIQPLLQKEDIVQLKQALNKVHLELSLEQYIVDLVFATRVQNTNALPDKDLRRYIQVGVSPRASIGLNLAAKAYALLQGRAYVIPDDIQAMLQDVFAHRLSLNFEADADGISKEQVVEYIKSTVAVNK
jgi:MoxR-like ATPase